MMESNLMDHHLTRRIENLRLSKTMHNLWSNMLLPLRDEENSNLEVIKYFAFAHVF